MKDEDCVLFLQWALPRLNMRWPGFRKVRRQVCKRVDRRMRDLGIEEVSSYISYLETHPGEWLRLDAMCRITISRFYRDRGVFDFLERCVVPMIAEDAASKGEEELRFWSIGCASGEEPYTLSLLWHLSAGQSFPSLRVSILATDTDPNLLARARKGSYSGSSLKELPERWLSAGFERVGEFFSIRREFAGCVEFAMHDVRMEPPDRIFHMILCRNLVFTYFEPSLQLKILDELRGRLKEGGVLVVGKHETLPGGSTGFDAWEKGLGIYRKCPS